MTLLSRLSDNNSIWQYEGSKGRFGVSGINERRWVGL